VPSWRGAVGTAPTKHVNPDASADNALAISTAPAVTPAIRPIDTAPIEVPPLPRPRPAFHGTVADGAAALISAFRQQYRQGSVAVSAALTRIAQEQANAMAGRDVLDHELSAPFSQRIGRSQFRRAAENIEYGHADFAGTLRQLGLRNRGQNPKAKSMTKLEVSARDG
jgi:uncharacterized protein YkwD